MSQLEQTAPHSAEVLHTQPRAAATAQAGIRMFFIDHLRVALTILVIMHHLAVTYGVVAPWYYLEAPGEGPTQLLLLAFVLFNQGFFMGFFFLIAGYFAPGSYDRKGAGAFLKDRLLRLGVPLLVFFLVLSPLTTRIGYSSIVALIGIGPLPPFWEFYFSTIGAGPLWFIEALLIFTLLYALWRRLTPPVTQVTTDALPPSYRAIIGFMVVLAVATFLWRIWVPIGWTLPILGFPTPGHLPQYISLFVIGTLAYRRNWFQSIPNSLGRFGWIAAIVATLILFPIALVLGANPNNPEEALFIGGAHWQAFVYALWEAILCVGMCLGLLTSFRKRFNRQGALGKFLSTHAYTVYIIHATAITALAYALGGIQLYPLLKFGLAVLLAIPLCFAVAYLVRKLPFAEKVL